MCFSLYSLVVRLRRLLPLLRAQQTQHRFFFGSSSVARQHAAAAQAVRICGLAGRRGLWMAALVGFGIGAGCVLAHDSASFTPAPTVSCSTKFATSNDPPDLKQAVQQSLELLRRVKNETGAPGLTVAVAVNGKTVWAQGLGLANLELRMPCKPDTVMRIASISKSLTMAALGRLIEAGKLDLDAPVQTYVPQFPQKVYEGEKVVITSRLLASHLSGIRHYEKDPKKVREDKAKRQGLLCAEKKRFGDGEEEVKSAGVVTPTAIEKSTIKKPQCDRGNLKTRVHKVPCENEEFYIKEKFDTVTDALKLFKDDPLIFKPGTEILYSTLAWTLLSAVVEGCSGQNFRAHMQQLFHDLGMSHTHLDEHTPIIYNRASYYKFDKRGRVRNAPYVDNSYKWAGGGFISTAPDLITFANAMLYSYQQDGGDDTLPGFLKANTVRTFWTSIPTGTLSWDRSGHFGLGWGVVDGRQKFGCCSHSRHYLSHTGHAVGASSVLLVLPAEMAQGDPPQGVVVAILCNIDGVGLNHTALGIAQIFERCYLQPGGTF
uniref:serine beta-lactamase-like protein LACTB, mitochondrial n=1 Tax=Myxine glutinosa TaxID=7769 RepID=UPI00358FBD7E